MKGFVGGIPIALLAVAAQAKFVERQEHGFVPQAGGTAMGGPSGDDSDGGFTSPYAADIKTNTQVNEYSKDDHHLNLKHTDIFPPPHHVHFGPPVMVEKGPEVPGMGPFEKRSTPGGTAMGGPSGDDEGQVFNMPITGIFQTEVNDYNKDDHSVAVKDTHVHPPPVHVVHPPPQFHGPPHGFHGRPAGPPSAAFNAPPSTFEKRWGPEEEGGTAMGGPGGGSHSHHGPEGYAHPHGGTAMGGPSGDDDGISFSKPVTGHFKTDVNEYSKDDHSIDLKHKDIHLPPHFPPWGAPFKRSWGPEHQNGGTAMGGPSGDDGGQEFNAPITIDTDTDVNEYNEDDHSIDLKHKDIYPPPPHFGGPGPVNFGAHPPFRRAYSPSREAGGGTAMGGPSGDDDGTSFSDPTNVDVTSGVNEHHEDNHAIKGDFTEVHPDVHPYYDEDVYEDTPYTYEAPPAPVEAPVAESYPAPPQGHAAPPAPVAEVPESHAEVPQAPTEAPASPPVMAPAAPPVADTPPREDHQECAAKVHEVVRTVTKTQYKTVEATPEYKQAASTSAVPMAAVPQMSAQVDPKVFSNAIPASAPASSAVRSFAPYSYASQRPMSQAASYSMIPVHVPMATPASSNAMATPSSSMAKSMPTGVDALSHGAQSSAAASPSASAHGTTMFEGSAARLSGGLFSAAAGVMGVLAFIL
ncbi:uncharacterized protein N7511_010392 [Penicillium nucicola]|uniref:uncharacterized protein n=1 Tax=Penicillium nucicola TaxID=1850975 RepID=UPI00254578F6|nr:uncharacterized protein N7511_010392 [Penicillium nucicola]KAJ5748696.1 hypothetical protein N7511_010392 [Penicillium nucicola]